MREILRWLAVTNPGRRAIGAAILDNPSLAVEPLGAVATREALFNAVPAWPETLGGFEDLGFLFTSGQLNMGIALLTFEEAALLFRTTKSLPRGATIAEVGRFKGGSTLLLAAAMPGDAHLWSYDLHVKLRGEMVGEQLDAQLAGALARYDLLDRVHLVVGDSRTAEAPPERCHLVFLDGDHSYEGVRADYERWRAHVRPGGHILFHDAAGATAHEGVVQLLDEIERTDGRWIERHATAGSIAHFVRSGSPAPWDDAATAPA
jgi:predicted O-methyltransferase YrrM